MPPSLITTFVQQEGESQFLLLKAAGVVKTKETSQKGRTEKGALDINLVFTGKTEKSLSASPFRV